MGERKPWGRKVPRERNPRGKKPPGKRSHRGRETTDREKPLSRLIPLADRYP